MQTKYMLYKCLATESGSSCTPTSQEFRDKNHSSALRLKRNAMKWRKKEKEYRKKTCVPLWQRVCGCDWAWPWKVKNFVCTIRAVLPSSQPILQHPVPKLYRGNHGMTSKALPSVSSCSKSSLWHFKPLNHYTDQNPTMHLVNCTTAEPAMLPMYHALANSRRGTSKLRKVYFLSWMGEWSQMEETSGEYQPPILCGSCGWQEEEALIKAALNCNQEFIVNNSKIIRPSCWNAVLRIQ